MTKVDLAIGGGIVGTGVLALLFVAPLETLIVLAVAVGVGGVTLAFLRWFGVLAPLYVQTSQAAQAAQRKQPLLLTDGRHQFTTTIQRHIHSLPMAQHDKQQLYSFVMQSDGTLSRLMQSEGVPVMLSGVRFGALTVTFRLRLREFSRANLDRLMKMDSLIAQALSVETVRLVTGAGWIDCEISSPVRVVVDVRALVRATHDTTVAIGLDTLLQPVTVDIAQHGLIAAIAPSRRGKTQSIRTMLYLLKRSNPSLNIVIVAFKSGDWAPFENAAAIILDSNELKQFQAWLLQTMYERAKRPQTDRWIVVFDDLVNLLSTNPELVETVKQAASLGAGTGITTIASTQFTGKSSGGTDIFANATARLLFKPSSNLQGARDGGMAGLGLDQLSTQRGDALLVCDGETVRLTTAMTGDDLIADLPTGAPDRAWLAPTVGTVSGLTLHPFEQLIEQLNGYILDAFDFETGKFSNRSEAMRQLGWSYNGRNSARLAELETYIFGQSERYQ